MTIKQALIFALITASTVTLSNAIAQTYQWKDSSGRTVISDTPPPGTLKENTRTLGGAKPATNAAPAAAKPSDAAPTMAEKDLEFKKRQQENAEKAGKEAKEKAALEAKRDNCERAKKQAAMLESGQRIASTDEKGERRIMEESERARELEYAQRAIKESCQ